MVPSCHYTIFETSVVFSTACLGSETARPKDLFDANSCSEVRAPGANIYIFKVCRDSIKNLAESKSRSTQSYGITDLYIMSPCLATDFLSTQRQKTITYKTWQRESPMPSGGLYVPTHER